MLYGCMWQIIKDIVVQVQFKFKLAQKLLWMLKLACSYKVTPTSQPLERNEKQSAENHVQSVLFPVGKHFPVHYIWQSDCLTSFSFKIPESAACCQTFCSAVIHTNIEEINAWKAKK